MACKALQFFTFFLLCFTLTSGSSVPGRQPLKEVRHDSILHRQEKKISSLSTVSITELDTAPTIPTVNPIPGSTTPTFSPSSPTPPTPTGPTTTPPTTPYTNPQNPTPTTTPPTSSGGGSWCVAKPDASPTALQVALDYACGFGGGDCSAIQPGASCYNPNTVKDHASYAFNDYYQKHPGSSSCVFGGAAQLTNTDPSNGNCHYPSGNSSPSTTPASPNITPPAMLTPPEGSIMTPPTTTMPVGTDYGAEPTGLPNSANSMSCSSLLLMTMVGFLGSLLPANYL